MIITFALLGIWFSTSDILVRPLLHSYNGSLVYFTLGSTFRSSKSASEKALGLYSVMYGTIIGFLAVQFKYRACVIAKQTWTKYFDDWKLALWILYVYSNGIVWTIGSQIMLPDEYTYEYVAHEIMANYGVNVRKIAIFIFVAYNEDNTIRWKTIVLYSTMYGVIIGFLAIQFQYRACVLAKTKWTKYFDGWKLGLWILYALSNGAVWAVGAVIVSPDEYAYQYLDHVIMSQYGVNVRKVALYAFLAYNEDNSPRWNTVGALAIFITVLMIQYTICLVCGVIMYRRMQGSLSSFSSQHENLQKQFFIALMYQVAAPLIFFHLPSLFIFILPFFDTKIDFHSTVLIYSFNVYPLVDSLILLKVVSEYKIALKKFRDMVAGEWAMVFRNGGIPNPSMSVVNARM
ncbi:unnamed protein product [Caenorhabditis nigoni]